MAFWSRLRQWIGSAEVEKVEDAALDTVFERRFREADRQRFNRLWREVARIVRVSPLKLNEDDNLRTLASAASRFPYTIMEQVADLVSDESLGVPERTMNTVGELMDWLLANPRVSRRGS